MKSNAIVDLTDDDDLENSAQTTQSTRPVIFPTQNPLSIACFRQPQLSTAMPTTFQPYTADVNTKLYSNILQQEQFQKRYYESYEQAVIRFSLINTKEFTAKTDGMVNKDVISLLKMVPGVFFDWKQRRWVFPLSAHDTLQVALSSCRIGIVPLPRSVMIAAQLQNRREATQDLTVSDSELQSKVHERLYNALADFQKEGVRFVLRNNGRAMIADEMGLGKTIQAIAVAAAYRDDWPVLVAVPSSARYHWQSELLTWLSPELIGPEHIALVESGTFTLHHRHRIVIISYHLVHTMEAKLQKKAFGVIIADESHYLKNGAARRSKHLLPLLESSKRSLLLSGTPALSRPIELFTQLHALAPSSWPDEGEFADRYCSGKKSKSFTNSQTTTASNSAELHAMLCATIMLRRLKKDILTQLPLKKRRCVYVTVDNPDLAQRLRELVEMIQIQTNMKGSGKSSKRVGGKRNRSNEQEDNEEEEEEGDKVNDDKGGWNPSAMSIHRTTSHTNDNNDNNNDKEYNSSYNDNNNIQQIAASYINTGTTTTIPITNENPKVDKKTYLMSLFNESGIAKLPKVLKHLETFLNNPLSGKILVFAHHRTVMDGICNFLRNRYQEHIRIDGQTCSKERFTRVQTFQRVSTCRVAVLAITAAGMAITLTAAATVYFAEMYWTPGSLLQAEDRAHRIGQLQPVTVAYFLAENTIDDFLWPLLRKKMRTLGEVVEGANDIDLHVDQKDAMDSNGGNGNGDSSNSGDRVNAGGNTDGDLKDCVEELSNQLADIIEEVAVEEKAAKVRREGDTGDGDGDVGDENNDSSSDEDSPPPQTTPTSSFLSTFSSKSSSATLTNNNHANYNGIGSTSRGGDGSQESEVGAVCCDEEPDSLAKFYIKEQNILQFIQSKKNISSLPNKTHISSSDGSSTSTSASITKSKLSTIVATKRRNFDIENIITVPSSLRQKKAKTNHPVIVDLEDDDDNEAVAVSDSVSQGNGQGDYNIKNGTKAQLLLSLLSNQQHHQPPTIANNDRAVAPCQSQQQPLVVVADEEEEVPGPLKSESNFQAVVTPGNIYRSRNSSNNAVSPFVPLSSYRPSLPASSSSSSSMISSILHLPNLQSATTSQFSYSFESAGQSQQSLSSSLSLSLSSPLDVSNSSSNPSIFIDRDNSTISIIPEWQKMRNEVTMGNRMPLNNANSNTKLDKAWLMNNRGLGVNSDRNRFLPLNNGNSNNGSNNNSFLSSNPLQLLNRLKQSAASSLTSSLSSSYNVVVSATDSNSNDSNNNSSSSSGSRSTSNDNNSYGNNDTCNTYDVNVEVMQDAHPISKPTDTDTDTDKVSDSVADIPPESAFNL